MIENGVAHRDLKIENIIVDSSNLQIKIIDFGYASFLQKQDVPSIEANLAEV